MTLILNQALGDCPKKTSRTKKNSRINLKKPTFLAKLCKEQKLAMAQKRQKQPISGQIFEAKNEKYLGNSRQTNIQGFGKI